MTEIDVYKNGIAYETDAMKERAFVYADGVFETMRCVNHHIPLWPTHLKRLREAEKRMHLRFDVQAIEKSLKGLLSNPKYENAVVKLILSRRAENRASYPLEMKDSDFFISIKHAPAYTPKSPVNLVIAPQPFDFCSSYARCKLISRVPYTITVATMKLKDNEEALLLDNSGDVVETIHHNIFIVKGHQIFTPSLEHCGVHGVMRAALIEYIIPALGVDVVQKKIKLNDLDSSDLIFISNAVDGIVLVNSIAERPYMSRDSAANFFRNTQDYIVTKVFA